MNGRRVATLVRKELVDLVRNHAALLPLVIVTIIALAVPFTIAFLVPWLTGDALGNDSDLVHVSRTAVSATGLRGTALVQAFLFQQFLLLFLLTPITGAMAIAAHAIIGEKQARTLEPLLATPISTFELLLAKVIGALVPTLAISAVGLALFAGAIGALAEPGVLRSMLTARTAVLVLDVGPLAALVSLQFAIVVSSRVNDARTAQQFGVLIILPLTGVLVAQFTGALWLSTSAFLLVALALFALWVLLALVSVALFDRETILTRWK